MSATLSTSHPRRSAQSKLAVAIREGKPQAEIDVLRRDFYAIALADHVKATVAKAPPLTAEQAARIAALLRPDGAS